ncbi:MAG TPA: cupin domain-containing protein [Gammaproteobacteria bacterium]|nr:cupin domain-containing protein [Gammaproteobacteria bacterium]
MPKLNLNDIPRHTGSSYPAPFHELCSNRIRQRLGDAGGLTDFGVNRLELQPGSWSSQRHWHSEEDEFVYIVAGELVLVTDEGEQTLRAGDCAAFPKGDANGHQLINKSNETAICLEVGGRSKTDVCTYSDIDMLIDSRDEVYRHNDGTAYPQRD